MYVKVHTGTLTTLAGWGRVVRYRVIDMPAAIYIGVDFASWYRMIGGVLRCFALHAVVRAWLCVTLVGVRVCVVRVSGVTRTRWSISSTTKWSRAMLQHRCRW